MKRLISGFGKAVGSPAMQWLGSFLTLLLSIAYIALQCRTLSIDIPTFHLDGAFQTASGLFRLQAGQIPGRDFLPYLGIGPLLLIFPLFTMVGGNVAASVFASFFVTRMTGWMILSVLWHLMFRPKMAITSLVGGAAVFLGENWLARKLKFPDLLAFLWEPGNSLRPLRAAIPYLLAISVGFLMGKCRSVGRNMAAGFIISVALLWSNDFAIPAGGLFMVFVIGFYFVKENETWIGSAAILIGTAVVSWVILLWLTTHGHPLQILRYNFVDVATDQWWYFAPYGPATRVFEWRDLTRLAVSANYFPCLLLLVSPVIALKVRNLELSLIAWLGLTLFAGGCVASIGGHIGEYFSGFQVWAYATALLAVLRVAHLILFSRLQYITLVFKFLSVGLLMLLLIGTGDEWGGYRRNLKSARQDANRFYVPELGGYLEVAWRGYVEYARQAPHWRVAEEFWGIWSALNRQFPPWPVDAVIHALGHTRDVSKAALAGVDRIITTRYTAATGRQPWSLGQNFWLYDDLLAHWVPEASSPTTIVWRKSDSRRERFGIDCRVADTRDHITLDAPDQGIYRVTLVYTTSGSGRYLFRFENNISYVADSEGFLSLPPGNQQTAVFPVFVTREFGATFHSRLVGSSSASASITT